jgi:hypothetical protein
LNNTTSGPPFLTDPNITSQTFGQVSGRRAPRVENASLSRGISAAWPTSPGRSEPSRPGRGSTGVHEAGFGRWNPQTLSLTDTTIPALNIADDTVEKYRAEMAAVIERAKARAA